MKETEDILGKHDSDVNILLDKLFTHRVYNMYCRINVSIRVTSDFSHVVKLLQSFTDIPVAFLLSVAKYSASRGDGNFENMLSVL